MVFANTDKEVELSYNKPVINDNKFDKLKEEILNR